MGREANRTHKREMILKAAHEIFLEAGFVAAKMDEIALRAKVTKQTVYRYFGSKLELFRETLIYIGKNSKSDFLRHLDHPDPERGLNEFAKAFAAWHMSERHLSVYRLLIAESRKAPGMTEAFFSTGPVITRTRLTHFFEERLGMENAGGLPQMCIGMLLILRDQVLINRKLISDDEFENYIDEVTHCLLLTARSVSAKNTKK